MGKKPLCIAEAILEQVYQDALNTLSALYVAGTFSYIEKNYPDLEREMTQTDENINRIWLLCLEGNETLDNFKKAVKYYEQLVMTALRIWEKDICQEQDQNKVSQKN